MAHSEGFAHGPRYKPWPSGEVYRGSPAGPTAVHEPAQPGSFPRRGRAPGDPRCEADCPCELCRLEAVQKYQYRGPVLPGFASQEEMGKDPIQGGPTRHPHPWMASTREMNTGRGCDTYGNAYSPPPRYEFIETYACAPGQEEYAMTGAREVDFGPEAGTEEFREGLARMRDTESYRSLVAAARAKDPDWDFADPVPLRPWEGLEKVEPNAWLREAREPERPADSQVREIEEWHRAVEGNCEPWPEWRPREQESPLEQMEHAATQELLALRDFYGRGSME